jgi:hypothetical protein
MLCAIGETKGIKASHLIAIVLAVEMNGAPSIAMEMLDGGAYLRGLTLGLRLDISAGTTRISLTADYMLGIPEITAGSPNGIN